MYGMPSDFAPTGFDTSLLLLSGYMLGGLAMLIVIAMILGIITLPLFFLILWFADRFFGVVASATGWFPAKLVLIMFRGLRRSSPPDIAQLPRAFRSHARALPDLRGPLHDRQRDDREGGELQGHRHAQDTHPEPDAAGLLHRVQAAPLRRERRFAETPAAGQRRKGCDQLVLRARHHRQGESAQGHDRVSLRARAGQGA